ncbi:hypothetical protein HaLaN_12419 [Haematococcus lacustris]|uniref:Uncharacterized protein n=1 Tax=Haematococcus lacustris TaxID=44745 RepID=A0A699Z3B5_HAELA|nr:hypothetical protein HaLaN_12419 [Haematococcus lacustris]
MPTEAIAKAQAEDPAMQGTMRTTPHTPDDLHWPRPPGDHCVHPVWHPHHLLHHGQHQQQAGG